MSAMIPDIPLPFPRRINPLADAVERHNRAWARRFGLIGSDAAARRFDDSDYGGFAALDTPDRLKAAVGKDRVQITTDDDQARDRCPARAI